MSDNNNLRATASDDVSKRSPDTLKDLFVRRTLVVVGIVGAVALLVWLLWLAVDVFLLIFAGILVGVFLYSLASVLSEHTPISYHSSLVIVVLTILAMGGLVAWLWAPRVVHEITQLASTLPQAIQLLRERINHFPLGEELLARVPQPSELLLGRAGVLSGITSIVSTMLGVLSSLIVVLFIGLYLAINPGLYQNGLLHLVPVSKRAPACKILNVLGYTLRWWLVGRITSMVIIGVLITVGLSLLGMPLAVGLGLLAGLLEYIPTIGPILSAVPALLIAFTQGQTQVLYVAALYIAVQALESYVITPLVFKKTVALPPAITLSVLVLFGVLFGFLGLLLATPLTVVVMVLIQMLYIEDVLGDESIDVVGEDL